MKKILILLVLLKVSFSFGQCFSKIAAGHYCTFAVKSDGTLWAWGGGNLGDAVISQSNTPIKIGTTNDWSVLYSGYWHTFGLKTNGTLWAWGKNDNGQLGSSPSYSYEDVPVQIGTDTNWSTIAVGKQDHTLGIKSDGTLWAWGNNFYYQLGDGTTTTRRFPTAIGTDTDWAQVSAGGYHSVALKTNGTLWSWGDNAYGQLGNGTTTDMTTPTQVGTLTTWSKIAAGENYTIAIKTDGTLWSWGLNTFGQLGDGSTLAKASPVQIGTATNWVNIAAEHDHCLAEKTDGSLWSWGRGSFGRLGHGNEFSSYTPVQIGTDVNWGEITLGYDHSIALKNDGSLWAWGYDIYGQVGDGVTIDNWSPTLIACPELSVSNFENVAESVVIYPNPTHEVLNVISQKTAIEKIELFDLLGRLIETPKGSNNHYTLSISTLENKTYMIKVYTKNGVECKKIIKN